MKKFAILKFEKQTFATKVTDFYLLFRQSRSIKSLLSNDAETKSLFQKWKAINT